MKAKGLYIGILFFLSSGWLFAQSEMDAYRFSQTELNGTARSMSMGGAFGALGGDMSVMSHNPAGLGVYRSSEVQTTLNLSMANMSSDWTGVNRSQNRTRFNFDNLSYVGYFPTGYDTGIKGWNFGISYNRVKNFYRTYQAVGNPKYSLADYTAAMATNAFDDGGIPEGDLKVDDPYQNSKLSAHWLSILGYKSGFFGTKYKWNDVYHSAFGERDGNDIWNPASPKEAMMNIRESGWISEYNFSASLNISDHVFLGATLGLSDINYRLHSKHDEDFGGGDYLFIENFLETNGTGYSFNTGVIIRPIQAFRFGIAYNSPKWYKMTDFPFARGESHIKAYTDKPKMDAKTKKGIFHYSYRSSDRWIFSMAGIIGTSALISIDYELTNYKTMRLGNEDATEYYNDITTQVKRDFKMGQTLKVGAEYRVTPQFAIRGGYVWQPSPMQETLMLGKQEVFTAGTVTHYTMAGQTHYYMAGLGYRFTPNFYMDLACIYRTQKEDLYPFSSVFIEDAKHHIKPVHAEPAKVTANTTRIALTLGYKF